MDENQPGQSRRAFVKKAVAAGALAWVAPTITSMGTAHAQQGTPRPQRCSPLSGDICDPNRATLTPARCQAQCDPGTPECRRVAPRDFCKGELRGPVFTRVVGGTTLFCQRCACVCGVFIP
jgi:hypothetical protein